MNLRVIEMNEINIELSNAYISLLKGIIIKENKEKIWDTILNYRKIILGNQG